MTNVLRVLIASIVAGTAALPACGDAWPRGDGNVYVHFGYARFAADTLFDASGMRRPFPGRDTEEKRVNLYIEAGLTDTLTLVASLPYSSIRTRGNVSTFESSGLADLDLRLRHSIRVGSRTFIGLDAGALVPMGYDEQEFPQLGTGKVDWIVSGSVGTSLGFLPEGFLAVDLGYRWRAGDISAEIPYSLKLGTFPFERMGVFVFARGWESRADWGRIETDFGLRAGDSERLAAGIEVYLRLTRAIDLNLVWTDPIRGRNTGDGAEWLIGIAWSTGPVF